MKRALWSIAIGMLAPLLASAANIAIPSQPLGSALQELAKQSGIQIIFFSKVVEGHDAPALNGTFTTEAALDTLLDATDLTYHVLNERTIEVDVRPVAAAAPTAPVSAEPADGPLAEVEITAERAEPDAIRAEIDRLENEFYAAYNKINTQKEYDVMCGMVRPTASHVDRRLCEPAFTHAQVGTTPGTVVNWPGEVQMADPTGINVPGYRRHMMEVVRRHPELLAIVKQRSELIARYQALRKQPFREAKSFPLD